MKALVPTRALLAILLLITPTLAVHLLRIVNLDEYVERRRYQPPEELPVIRLDPESVEHFQFWMNRLLDRSLAIVGPCRPAGNMSSYYCSAPAYPLFPLSDTYRNSLLLRPPPDEVRAHIEQASKGELSTVDELVAKVIANIENLDVLNDDEVALLATNFAVPEAGVTVAMGCGPFYYSGWHEDMLVPQDERRALLAAFLYAVSDEGYVARREAALEEAFRVRIEEIERESEQLKQWKEQCDAVVYRGGHLFIDKVDALDNEVLIPEAEWVARYNEYLAALRAELYGAVPRGVRGWNQMRPSIEELVDVTEKVVSDDLVCRYVAADEPGFIRFLYEILEEMRGEYQGLRDGVLRRLAYRRWKMLPLEEQAAYT
ncbi:hypothetical protein CONLIGDRAFT_630803 [Coniochaeta ligniaria NRRL 30616]|uniref:Terpenoid synthase n=1 Tax=Coniochaeta ligniaria NRRL 30616 TaxID=1408157 RepID=A0A1J7JC59_9PEZI|nr:hypothetical protein CONLIGDRAFT_630803 [Coniochaeta ligniaria NRRL 30616]